MEYPLSDIFGGHYFIGLDTMASEHDGFDAIFADGELGKDQIDETVKRIKEYKQKSNGKVIVYLHHHPFLFPDEFLLRRLGERVGHWLKDGKKFMNTIKDLKVDVLLFGHEHCHLYFKDTAINRKYNISHIISSGKSTEYGREFPVLEDGRADKPTYECKDFADSMDQYEYDLEEDDRIRKELEGIPRKLYGRMIEIKDDDITVDNVVFG